MQDALHLLAEHAPRADMVELRLDLIHDYDLERLLAASPRPALVTFRPRREGGRYGGSESARLSELQRAAALGAAWIDVEIDAWRALGTVAPARKLVSHHEFGAMPSDLERLLRDLEQADAEAIKLAVMARAPAEAGQVLDLFDRTSKLAVLLPMGEAGVAGRLLCLRHDNCLLTFVAAGSDQATAPGQVSLDLAQAVVPARAIGPRTLAIGYFGPDPAQETLGRVNAELRRLRVDAVCVPLGTRDPGQAIQALAPLHLSGALVAPPAEADTFKTLREMTESARRLQRANTLLVRSGGVIGDHLFDLDAQLRALLQDV